MVKTLVIVGGQYGDEGKGKVIDFLAEKADVIARYAGGNNAGHTVVVGKLEFKFHLLPSGIIHKGVNVIGNGCVIDPDVLMGEIVSLQKSGFEVSPKNLIISSAAHVILDRHREEDKGNAHIGTTGRGIGPCYKDKVGRTGMRMAEYVKQDVPNARFLRPFVRDTPYVMNEAIAKGKKILFEGAQGTLLDVDHGTYPFVTSSNPTSGGVCTGLGISPRKVQSVMGVCKAYKTRVGNGPFPTEITGAVGQKIQKIGK